MSEPAISVQDLRVEFSTVDGIVKAVDGVSYDVYPGEVLGVVGESGSGKSVTVMSILGLIPQPPGKIAGGKVIFNGEDIVGYSEAKMRKVRSAGIAMVFQDPMTSLNPVFTVGFQIAEALLEHNSGMSKDDAKAKSVKLLDDVGVPEAEVRFDQYPHEYSGGMRQRAMIAMAMANNPKVMIADEPTTALDVTIQAQVLDVLKAAQLETQAATILITHDLGLIAEMADRVAVMYGGKIVEMGTVEQIFHAPRHPYTLGLIMSLPRLDRDLNRLLPIPGNPPSLIKLPPGCSFHPRCSMSNGRDICRTDVPELVEVGHDGQSSRCHFAMEVAAHLEAQAAIVGLEAEDGVING